MVQRFTHSPQTLKCLRGVYSLQPSEGKLPTDSLLKDFHSRASQTSVYITLVFIWQIYNFFFLLIQEQPPLLCVLYFTDFLTTSYKSCTIIITILYNRHILFTNVISTKYLLCPYTLRANEKRLKLRTLLLIHFIPHRRRILRNALEYAIVSIATTHTGNCMADDLQHRILTIRVLFNKAKRMIANVVFQIHGRSLQCRHAKFSVTGTSPGKGLHAALRFCCNIASCI